MKRITTTQKLIACARTNRQDCEAKIRRLVLKRNLSPEQRAEIKNIQKKSFFWLKEINRFELMSTYKSQVTVIR